ncbi:MAG TPA: hypothetical protein VK188_04765 [Holophaga sp.]|nr:hypothetical protein [Holophaga sp.]
MTVFNRYTKRHPCLLVAVGLLIAGGHANAILMAGQDPSHQPPAPSVERIALPSFAEILEQVLGHRTVVQARQGLVQARAEGRAQGVVWERMTQATPGANAVVAQAVRTQSVYINSAVAALGDLRLEWIAQGHDESAIADHVMEAGRLLLTYLGDDIATLFSADPTEAEAPEEAATTSGPKG